MNTNLLSEYWEQYKLEFDTQLFEKREKYKWGLFSQMYPRWNWDPNGNNLEMFKSTFQVNGPTNLWLSGNFFPIEMCKWMMERFPLETRNAMNLLFEESSNITERITGFTKVFNEKLPELAQLITEKPIKHHYHKDLRAISIYLTLQYPEKYVLYKHGMFTALSSALELQKVKSGDSSNYEKYLSVVNQLRTFIRRDAEFIARYNNFISIEGNYQDEHLHLLVQDFIYSIGKYYAPEDTSKFKELIYDFDEYIKAGDTILNQFNINDKSFSNYYVFYWDSQKIIGDKIVHYEIIERKNLLYVEVHFEGTKSQRDFFSNSITALPENIVTYSYKYKNLRYNEGYSYDDADVIPKLANALLYIEENLGDLLRTLKNSTPTNNETNTPMNNNPLNQILFGPPGTGKTFNSINEALKIVSKNYFEEHKNDREKLTNKFKELLINNWEETKGQIAFCTFHQSFSYEDFVEGIKPKTTNDKNVYYDIEPGVFKRICQLAESNNSTVKVIKEGKFAWNEEQFNKATFYKLSLGAIYNPQDKPIYEYCRDNNYIAIGFGEENDFSGMNESQIVEKCKELELETTSSQQLNYFIHNIKKNNYVIIGNGNKYVRAIGKVIGDYEYVADSPIQYNHFRKVEWLFVDANIPIEELYGKGLSQKTLYKIDETALKKDFFTNKGQKEVIEDKEDKKYVLIIDEINRGNVSSIFGELITLIEKDKRAGSTEELEITLPYSKEPFKVPSNVYIIGTMNTADRSVEALDTALRRRFSFKEIMPDDKVITEKNFKDYDRASIMNLINQRIEVLLDRNYTLGHSYFIKEDFKNSFENEIIPLLQEYFYNDYGKIGLVLGKGFVREKEITKNNNKNIFADFDTKNEVDIVKSYELIPFNDINFKEALDILLL